MNAYDTLSKLVQEEYEKEKAYNKALIKEDLHNWKPSKYRIKENKSLTLVYDEDEIPKLNVLGRPTTHFHGWHLEALFRDGYSYQENVSNDATFSNGLALTFLKTYIDSHGFGFRNDTLSRARQMIFLMRAIVAHKEAYEKDKISNPERYKNTLSTLSELKQLHDAGLITQAEFDRKKQELLDRL